MLAAFLVALGGEAFTPPAQAAQTCMLTVGDPHDFVPLQVLVPLPDACQDPNNLHGVKCENGTDCSQPRQVCVLKVGDERYFNDDSIRPDACSVAKGTLQNLRPGQRPKGANAPLPESIPGVKQTPGDPNQGLPGETPDKCDDGEADGSLLPKLGDPIGLVKKMISCGITSLGVWPEQSHGIGTQMVEGLTNTPNYTQEGSNLWQVGQNTSAVAYGLIAATMTFAVIQLWLTGLMRSQGGLGGAEGIASGVGAAFGIMLWPWGFDQSVAVSNALSDAVITSGTQERAGNLLTAGLFVPGAQGLAVLAFLILAAAGTTLMLGLIALKIAMSATLSVLYVTMPILLALSPVPFLKFLPRLGMKIMVLIVMLPTLWACLFATAAGLMTDSMTFGNFTLKESGVFGAILRPIVAMTVMYLAIKLPKQLATLGFGAISGMFSGAGGGGGGGGGGRGGGPIRSALQSGTNALRQAATNTAKGMIPGASPGHRVPTGITQFMRDGCNVAAVGGNKVVPGGVLARADSAVEEGLINRAAGGMLASHADLIAGSQRLNKAIHDEVISRNQRGIDDLGSRIEKAERHAGNTDSSPRTSRADSSGAPTFERGTFHGLKDSMPPMTGAAGEARDAAVAQADHAFGYHPVEAGALSVSQQQAAVSRESFSDLTASAERTPQEKDAAMRSAETAALHAYGQFTPRQQEALGRLRDADPASFDVYASHLSYSPHLSEDQRGAAQTLADTPGRVHDYHAPSPDHHHPYEQQ